MFSSDNLLFYLFDHSLGPLGDRLAGIYCKLNKDVSAYKVDSSVAYFPGVRSAATDLMRVIKWRNTKNCVQGKAGLDAIPLLLGNLHLLPTAGEQWWRNGWGSSVETRSADTKVQCAMCAEKSSILDLTTRYIGKCTTAHLASSVICAEGSSATRTTWGLT